MVRHRFCGRNTDKFCGGIRLIPPLVPKSGPVIAERGFVRSVETTESKFGAKAEDNFHGSIVWLRSGCAIIADAVTLLLATEENGFIADDNFV